MILDPPFASCSNLGRALLAGACIACGPVAAQDGGVDDAGGSTTAEPPRECVGMPTPGVDPFAGEPSCATYVDLGWTPKPLQTRIVNELDAPVVVTNRTFGCNQPSRRFDFAGTMGGRSMEAPAADCPYDWSACASYLDGDPGCLLCGTLYPDIYIAPGGWFAEPWDAWLASAVVLPGGCVDQSDDLPCFAAVSLAEGSFTATAHGMSVSPDDPSCGCVPDASGSCAIEGGCDFVETITATATHDGVCDTLEIVFSAAR